MESSLTLSIQVKIIIEYREYTLQSRWLFGPFQRNTFDHMVLTNLMFHHSYEIDRYFPK